MFICRISGHQAHSEENDFVMEVNGHSTGGYQGTGGASSHTANPSLLRQRYRHVPGSVTTRPMCCAHVRPARCQLSPALLSAPFFLLRAFSGGTTVILSQRPAQASLQPKGAMTSFTKASEDGRNSSTRSRGPIHVMCLGAGP